MLQLRNISIFHGIGRRLLLWFSLFFLIPLVTVSYTGYHQSKKAIQKQVYDHFESLLNLQKEALVSYLHQKEIQLASSVAENDFLFIATVVRQSTTFSKGDILAAQDRIQKYVTEKNKEMGSRSLYILGKKGYVIASSDPEWIGQDRSTSPEFETYLNNESPMRSHYVETFRGPEVLLVAPIKSASQRFLGLYTMSINMEEIYNILENRIGLGASGETYLVDAKGFMISPSRFQREVILKKRVRLNEIFEGTNWRTSARYPLNYRGIPVIQAHTPFPFFGWTLIAEMETSEAFKELTTQRNRTAWVVTVLFFLLVIIAAVISRTLTQPIRTLAQAAKRVSEGDLDQKIMAKSRDELGDLGFEFNRMTISLKESKQRMEEWNATIQQEVEIRTQELKNSELKFRNLMEKANDAIMIFNIENKLCALANLKAEILTGYSQEELLSTRFYDLFLSDDMQRVMKHYKEALHKGSAYLYNIPLQVKDRRLVYVDISNSLIDFQGQKFINCILHDVTEQRRMVREREAVFEISDIIAKSSDLEDILTKALDNILLHLELDVAVIFLYNNKTNDLYLACQKGFSEAFIEKYGHQEVTEKATTIFAKTAYTREMQYLQDPFEGSMNIFFHPNVDIKNLQTAVCLPLIAEDTLVGILQVITTRKRRFSGVSLILLEALANQLAAGILRIQLEQAKHKDDQFLASILTDSLDAIVSLDAEDLITSWNRGAENIFRLNKEKVLGESFSTLFQEEPGHFNKEQIQRALMDKGFIKNYEIESVIWDGREVTLHVSQTAILDHYGKFIGSFAIIRDVTEQKAMQERIQQSEKLSSVGQLAAGIAHEIGTPLNIISGNAEYLMMDLDKKDTKMEELSIIIQQTERITKLIQQLMDFARDTQPSFELTDIHPLIENTLTLTRHQLKKYSILLDAKLNSSIPKIIADPNQLQQVFLNIIINAIHAMPRGGTLSIEVSLDHDNEAVQVLVRDTGYGISKANLKNVFDPFFTTKEVGQGTGLGLAVSHRIIENHKGRIDVESRLNHGTCFKITLPLHAEES